MKRFCTKGTWHQAWHVRSQYEESVSSHNDDLLTVPSNPCPLCYKHSQEWGSDITLPSGCHNLRLPFSAPGDLPDPGITSVSLTSPALAGGFFTTSTTWEALPEFNT